MIEFAYSLQWGGQLADLKEEIGAYDIDARTPFPATEAQQKLMLQDLLAERFHLVCHHEQRDEKVYALVAGRNPKLDPAEEGQQGDATVPDGSPDAMKGSAKTFIMASAGSGAMSYHAASASMEDLAKLLGIWFGGAMMDETGLKGKYRITLQAIATPSADDAHLIGPEGRDLGPRYEVDSGNYLAAVRRLGLDVIVRRAPMDVLVVDHIEKPSAN
jgi:uncharacterized protein (TIGR03435 family)